MDGSILRLVQNMPWIGLSMGTRMTVDIVVSRRGNETLTTRMEDLDQRILKTATGNHHRRQGELPVQACLPTRPNHHTAPHTAPPISTTTPTAGVAAPKLSHPTPPPPKSRHRVSVAHCVAPATTCPHLDHDSVVPAASVCANRKPRSHDTRLRMGGRVFGTSGQDGRRHMLGSIWAIRWMMI